jgi:hypothetical protein
VKAGLLEQLLPCVDQWAQVLGPAEAVKVVEVGARGWALGL